jgi:hypothetical protein
VRLLAVPRSLAPSLSCFPLSVSVCRVWCLNRISLKVVDAPHSYIHTQSRARHTLTPTNLPYPLLQSLYAWGPPSPRPGGPPPYAHARLPVVRHSPLPDPFRWMSGDGGFEGGGGAPWERAYITQLEAELRSRREEIARLHAALEGCL